MMPPSVRDPALALYAFCRLVDDGVDEGGRKAQAVLSLSARLDRVYAGAPRDALEDRAFAAIVSHYNMPRALPEALLEGLAWDTQGRRYHSLSQLCAYSADVASAVGAMMCVLMEVRDPHVLSRACDLGVAMQLTNIARDVGEEAGIDVPQFLARPVPSAALCGVAARLLSETRKLYLHSQAGVPQLPRRARIGIYAARFIYAGIGTELRRQGYDSVTSHAHTSKLQKMMVSKSALYTARSVVMPQPAMLYAPPLPEVAFLVDAVAAGAAAVPSWGAGRAGTLLEALANLKAHDSLIA